MLGTYGFPTERTGEICLMNMHFQSDSPAQKDHCRPYFIMLCVIAAVVVAGCASAPRYRSHENLPEINRSLKSIGLLAPILTVYEEQAEYKLIPQKKWTQEAGESIGNAFLEAAAERHLPLTLINGQDRETDEIADLFSAVDYSIAHHAYYHEGFEEFPEKTRFIDYSVGPVRDLVERYRVDALWIVVGFNLLPTPEAKLQDAVNILASLLSTIAVFAGSPGSGMAPSVYYPVPAGTILKKLEMRAALIDKSGTILFYCKLDDGYFPKHVHNPEPAGIEQEDRKSGCDTPEEPEKEDLRDRKTARLYIKALFAEYAKAAGP